jgi:hypothetical protein
MVPHEGFPRQAAAEDHIGSHQGLSGRGSDGKISLTPRTPRRTAECMATPRSWRGLDSQQFNEST